MVKSLAEECINLIEKSIQDVLDEKRAEKGLFESEFDLLIAKLSRKSKLKLQLLAEMVIISFNPTTHITSIKETE